MKIKRLKINELTQNSSEIESVCNVAICDSFFSRLRGMIGRQFDEKDFNAMALIPCNQIHTHFMQFPIDVVYLNDKGEVIAIMKDVPQGSFCKSVAGAKTVIEFPAGSIEKYRIREGDDVRFE